MALTYLSTASTRSTDKGIFINMGPTAGILYTVPMGKKFIGNLMISAGTYLRIGGRNYNAGTNGSGLIFPLFLFGGQFVEGVSIVLNGIESDA